MGVVWVPTSVASPSSPSSACSPPWSRGLPLPSWPSPKLSPWL